ncbi:Dedicator of cytokinesis protein 9 [Balamuthia mandrillaris]
MSSVTKQIRRRYSRGSRKSGSFEGMPTEQETSATEKKKKGLAKKKEDALPAEVVDAVTKIQDGKDDGLMFDFEKLAQSDEVRKDPLQEILRLPPDDVEVETVPRECTTTKPTVPEGVTAKDMPRAYLRDCIDFFSKDWTVVKRKYAKTELDFGNAVDAKALRSLPKQKYETIDAKGKVTAKGKGAKAEEKGKEKEKVKKTHRRRGSSVSSTPNTDDEGSGSEVRAKEDANKPPNLKLLAEYNKKVTDAENAEARNKTRLGLFDLFTKALTEGNSLGRAQATIPAKPFSDVQRGIRKIMVTPKSISFSLGDLEPVFGILAVYSMTNKRRISENYYFNVNSSESNGLIAEHNEDAVKGPIAKSAIFSISSPSEDCYLVLRIEKVLQGEIEACTEPYIKYETLKDKDKERLEAQAKDACKRLGSFRQPMAWSIIPLFNEDGELQVGKSTTFSPIYRQKSDVSDSNFLASWKEQSKSTGSKRMKVMPGSCVVDVVEVGFVKEVEKEEDAKEEGKEEEVTEDVVVDYSSNLQGKLNPSLIPLKPENSSEDEDVILEIQEFPLTPWLAPRTTFVNNLYIYPECANLNARNIAIRVQLLDMDSDPENDSIALKAIYAHGDSGMPQRGVGLQQDMWSSINYHNKNPVYYDEFKVQLPATLTGSHHLLFSFYHVSCQPTKSKDQPIEKKIVGYAFLPLYTQDKFVGKEHALPVALNLTPGYLTPEVQDELKWIDNRKTLFKFRLKLVSSLYTQDVKLNKFFAQLDNLSSTKKGDTTLAQAVTALSKVHPFKIIQFLPIVFNQLFRIMCVGPPPVQAEAFSTLLSLISNVNRECDIADMLRTYATYAFENVEGCSVYPYEQILRFWVDTLLKSQGELREKLIHFAWFFFSVSYRSMVLRVKRSKGGDSTPRHKRISESFMRDLRSLMVLFTHELQQGKRFGLTLAKALNLDIAMFLRDLLSLIDRGVVCGIIARMLESLVPNGSDGEVVFVDMKLSFLQLISQYEHFVPLNLPLPPKPLKAISSLLEEFKQKHFMAGLLIEHASLYVDHPEKQIRSKAVETVRKLIISHCIDERYASKPVLLSRIANTYFPFVAMILPHTETYELRDLDERRNLLIAWLWVLKHADPALKKDWWKKESRSHILLFLDTLKLCVDTFQYIGKKKLEKRMTASQVNTSASSTKAALESFYTDVSGGGARAQIRAKEGEQRQFRRTLEKRNNKQAASTEPQYTFYPEIESNLSTEVSLTVLDVAEEFIHCFKKELVSTGTTVGPGQVLMDRVFALLMALLKNNQSETVYTHLYAVLRSFVHKFAKLLFYSNTAFCAELCPVVLSHCNFNSPLTREEASAFVYLLMKKNIEEVRKNFTRVKVQTTIALSYLVGQGIKDDTNLRRSLSLISQFAQLDKADITSSGKPFAQQVEELCDRLHTILRDSVKINQYDNDPEMMADLYYRISKSYANTPDLRVTWLINLANFHADKARKNWAEAGQCTLHIAALIAEYLHMKNSGSGAPPLESSSGSQILSRGSSGSSLASLADEDLENAYVRKPNLPDGCRSFVGITPNALEEALAEISSVGDEGVCESNLFTEIGLTKIMYEAIDNLKKAELYETANELYKLLIPMHEANRDYKALADCHEDLQHVFKQIVTAEQTQGRMLGSYYRVAFFGAGFEELDGKEFIYKEPKITRLVEIKDRLVELYTSRLGENKVSIWTDSGAVDRSKLDPSLCYIQITSVDPYFDAKESASRLTYYERNNNLNQFIFDTPFTLGKSAQASNVAEQHKRKTILTVDSSFPYVKKRLPVAKKEEINLTPIENSLENITSRTALLVAQLRAQPPNSKTLQALLQGSVRLQVHAGPLEICKAFLGSNASQYEPEKIAQLRLSLQRFLRACERALELNKAIITTDQVTFQEELQKGYESLRDEMMPFLSSTDK